MVKEGRLAGIFTLTDVRRSYGNLPREIYPRGSGHHSHLLSDPERDVKSLSTAPQHAPDLNPVPAGCTMGRTTTPRGP